MKTQEELTRKINKDVINEFSGYSFHYEYFGEEINFLNMLCERKELIPRVALEVGMKLFGYRKDRSGMRKDGGVQLAYNHGFGGGYVYIIIPSQMDNLIEGKRIRVFANVAYPDGAIIDVCNSFIEIFEKYYPFKESK